ncbi:CU044_5270 family protein [Streptomyces sp. NBC_00344]|uniref:CU044_5270 family protein n=1 Tax=Streptomyces sp. NBC_00344 TaxID=2975720 RepID=UPI002E240138
MNDLYDPSALRADAPLPDSERLAPQRAVLVAASRQETDNRRPAPSSARLPRRRIVLVTAAAAAAAAVIGGVILSLPDRSSGQTAGIARHTATGGRMLSAQASADTLELAAATVAKMGSPEPGPKQWVYEKSTSLGQGIHQPTEQWTRWDGTGDASLPGIAPVGSGKGFDPKKLQVRYGPNQEAKWKKEGYEDRSQRQFYDFLKTLPSDPDLMMQRILHAHAIGDIKGETAAQRDWREIDVLYRSVLIPPNAQAGLFRALAKVPGARVEKGIKDALGRPAIGVTVNYPKPIASGHLGRQEIWFDPTTYAYLGEVQHVAPVKVPKELPKGAPVTPAQDPNPAIITVRNASGVVDKPGARP